MHHLFRSNGRSLMVAMDHGIGMNVYPALQEPGEVITAIREGGADALLTTAGILKQFQKELGSMAVILRADRGNLILCVEDALRLGADAVCCMGFPDSEDEPTTLENLTRLAAECRRWNVPLMAEMLPGGFNQEQHTPEKLQKAARIGVELGAELIKTELVGNPEDYRFIMANAYRPVLALGGGKKDEEGLLAQIRQAMDAGAAGAVVGRNVWMHDNPKAMVQALCTVIHENANVDRKGRVHDHCDTHQAYDNPSHTQIQPVTDAVMCLLPGLESSSDLEQALEHILAKTTNQGNEP